MVHTLRGRYGADLTRSITRWKFRRRDGLHTIEGPLMMQHSNPCPPSSSRRTQMLSTLYNNMSAGHRVRPDLVPPPRPLIIVGAKWFPRPNLCQPRHTARCTRANKFVQLLQCVRLETVPAGPIYRTVYIIYLPRSIDYELLAVSMRGAV